MNATRYFLPAACLAATLAGQTPTLVLPKDAACEVKVVGMATGQNPVTIRRYAADGTALPPLTGDASNLRAFTAAVPGTVASLTVDAPLQTRVSAACTETRYSLPFSLLGPLGLAPVPKVSNYRLAAQEGGVRSLPIPFFAGLAIAPLVSHQGSGSATIAVSTTARNPAITTPAQHTARNVLAGNSTMRATMDELLGGRVSGNSTSGVITVQDPDSPSLHGATHASNPWTSFLLEPGEEDSEFVLPHHFTSQTPWRNAVAVHAAKPAVVYFTAKAGRTTDVQRRELAAGTHILQVHELFPAATPVEWILVRASEPVRVYSLYAGNQVTAVNGLSRLECGYSLLDTGAQAGNGRWSASVIVNTSSRDNASVTITGYAADRTALALRQTTIPPEGKLLTNDLAAYLNIPEAQARNLRYATITGTQRLCSTGFAAGTHVGNTSAYRNLPTDPVLSTASIDGAYNPRTGQFDVEHSDTVTVTVKAVVNAPTRSIINLAFDGNVAVIEPVKFAFSGQPGDYGRKHSASATIQLLREAMRVESLAGTLVYNPQLSVTSTPAGTVTRQYPMFMKVFDEQYYAVGEIPNAFEKVKANPEAFARILSDPAGWVQPLPPYNSILASVKQYTDRDTANGEFLDFSIQDSTRNEFGIKEITPSGNTRWFGMAITNDPAGERKVRQLQDFFGLRERYKY